MWYLRDSAGISTGAAVVDLSRQLSFQAGVGRVRIRASLGAVLGDPRCRRGPAGLVMLPDTLVRENAS